MKPYRTVSMLVAALALLGGCKTEHEKLAASSVAKMREVADVLKTVTDEPSAKAAAPKLQAIAADLKKVQDDMLKLGEPSGAAQKDLGKKYGDQMKSASADLSAELTRIGKDPRLYVPLKDALAQFGRKAP